MQNLVSLSDPAHLTPREPALRAALTKSPFPSDAHAVIYRPAPSPMTSGRARLQQWKLRFERRSAPYIEPLMGWTADDDALSQVELCFPSVESAVAYARSQGLQYTVQGGPEREAKPFLISDNLHSGDAPVTAHQRRRRLEWVERTLGPDMSGQSGRGIDPAATYPDPQDVLRDPKLTEEEKRNVLQRWAFDAYQIEIEHSKGKLLAVPSRLQQVIDALLDLEDPQLAGALFHKSTRKDDESALPPPGLAA
jgi:hypothetical protein